MSDNHQHAAQPIQMQQAPRRPADERIIARLNMSLDARATEIRSLQDQLTFQQALSDELVAENTGYQAALDQVTTENRILRQRLGLPEVGAVDLEDETSAAPLVIDVPVDVPAIEADQVAGDGS